MISSHSSAAAPITLKSFYEIFQAYGWNTVIYLSSVAGFLNSTWWRYQAYRGFLAQSLIETKPVTDPHYSESLRIWWRSSSMCQWSLAIPDVPTATSSVRRAHGVGAGGQPQILFVQTTFPHCRSTTQEEKKTSRPHCLLETINNTQLHTTRLAYKCIKQPV